MFFVFVFLTILPLVIFVMGIHIWVLIGVGMCVSWLHCSCREDSFVLFAARACVNCFRGSFSGFHRVRSRGPCFVLVFAVCVCVCVCVCTQACSCKRVAYLSGGHAHTHPVHSGNLLPSVHLQRRDKEINQRDGKTEREIRRERERERERGEEGWSMRGGTEK